MEARQPISYSGQGFSPIGDKDRFVLPPQFRKTVRESSNNTRVLCLARHDRWDCLTGFGLSRREDLARQIDREEALAVEARRDFDRDMRYIQLYGFTEVPFDDSGRFVVPPQLKSFVKPGEGLFFLGSGPAFTMWNPSVMAAMGPGWEAAQAACLIFVEAARARA